MGFEALGLDVRRGLAVGPGECQEPCWHSPPESASGGTRPRRHSPGPGPQSSSVSPTYPPGPTPGGTAKMPLVSCRMYSLSASLRARRSWTGMKPVRGIPLVGDEEQAGVELVADRVDPVGERVAPPEHRRPAVGLGRREPHVGVGRDHELAVLARGQVQGLALAALPERRPALLHPTDGLFLVSERRAVPHLEEHPDAAHDEVRPVVHPCGLVVGADPEVTVAARRARRS